MKKSNFHVSNSIAWSVLKQENGNSMKWRIHGFPEQGNWECSVICLLYLFEHFQPSSTSIRVCLLV